MQAHGKYKKPSEKRAEEEEEGRKTSYPLSARQKKGD